MSNIIVKNELLEEIKQLYIDHSLHNNSLTFAQLKELGYEIEHRGRKRYIVRSPKLKTAMYAKLYSATETNIAKITGSYPPPHKEIDIFTERHINALPTKKAGR